MAVLGPFSDRPQPSFINHAAGKGDPAGSRRDSSAASGWLVMLFPKAAKSLPGVNVL